MLAFVVAAALLAPAAVPAHPRRTCVNVASASNTHYHPVDDHTVLIESGRDWFRLGVSPTAMLTDPSTYILSEVRGSSLLCSPVDFDLAVVSQPGAFREPMIAQSFDPIPADEAKALLRKSRR